jgi:hypothetical protein
MANLITRLRVTIDDTASALFTDAELQTTLDQHKWRVDFEPLEYEYTHIAGGSVEYKIYHSHFGNYEEGTALFQIEDSAGSARGTADYAADYVDGVFTFTADQAGTALYLTGWSYDLNGAAANCWGARMAKVATRYDVNLDGHNLSRSQLIAQCKTMADYYAQHARPKQVRMYNNGIFR